jgi:hypothetical protein
MVVLALFSGGWMVFDGTRALVTGDYTTPNEGAYAGQLGPWSQVVQAIGIPPRSTPMKAAFVAFGIGWLIVAYGLARRKPWALKRLIGMSVATLWYLPVGTAVSLLVLIVAGILRARSKRGSRGSALELST